MWTFVQANGKFSVSSIPCNDMTSKHTKSASFSSYLYMILAFQTGSDFIQI